MKRKEEEVDKIKKNIGIIKKLQFGARGSGICFLIKTSSFIKMRPKKTNFYVFQNHQRKQPRLIYRTQFQNTKDKERTYLLLGHTFSFFTTIETGIIRCGTMS